MEYLDIKKLVMVWLLIAPIIIIAEVAAQDRNQTHFKCNQTQVLRQGKDGEEVCCHSAKCKLGEKFHLCTENYGNDICLPCGDGYFTALSVDTALVHIQFDPCMKLQCEDGAANINGSCICDILNGYYGNDSSRCIPKNCTAGFVLSLDGHCKLCEKKDNCGKITFERQSSDVSFYWIIVGIVLIATAGTLLGIIWYRSRILKTLNADRNSSPDDISDTDVNATDYRNSTLDDMSNTYVDVPKFPTACPGNDKTGKKQNDLENDYLDPASSESLEGFSTIKKIECQEQRMHRCLKEKEKKQQALPLNPRPFVVDCCGDQIQQESSFSSYSDYNTYQEIGAPYNADSTNEFQMEHVVDDNLLLQEQNVSSGQNWEINNVVEVPYATAANKEYENYYSYTDACSNETYSVESSCYCAGACCTASDTRYQSCEQEYSFSETNDVTNHSHDDTFPKVECLRIGEQPYFNRLNVHSSPHSRANNPTVDENLCEVDKSCSEEDQRRLYENVDDKYQSNNELDSDVILHITETASDEDRCVRQKEFVKTSEREMKTASSNQCVRQKEFVKTREKERKTACSISQESKDQSVLQKESVKTRKEKSPIRTEEQEPSICTDLVQRHNDNDLLLKNQERHNLTSSKVDKDQCVRPKEFKPREETNELQRIVQEDKFNTPTSESHRDLASHIGNFVQKARMLTEENKSLKDENEQQGLAIKKLTKERDNKTSEVLILQEQLVQLQMALQEKTQKLNSIEQYLPVLTDLLGQEPLPDKSHQKDTQMTVYYDKQSGTAESNAHL